MNVPGRLRIEALIRARGRCECSLSGCGHYGRCIRPLTEGHWDIRLLNPGGPDTLENVQAVCEECVKRAPVEA